MSTCPKIRKQVFSFFQSLKKLKVLNQLEISLDTQLHRKESDNPLLQPNTNLLSVAERGF